MSHKIFGLVGKKLGHSYSPMIHKMLGCGNYRLFELQPEELSKFFSENEIGGLNVTIPYKRDAMAFCDYIDSRAEKIGCINTIVNNGGKLCGYNTDIDGFSSLIKKLGITDTLKKALVLGTGGTSLTAIAALGETGIKQIVNVSRKGPVTYSSLSEHWDAELIVNTTPVGMFPNSPDSIISLRDFPLCRGVIDVIYNPHRTGLIMQAEALGIPCTGGLPMLVTQAKAAEELFFGKTIDNSAVNGILASIYRKTDNIIIIGMPGSGKTSVGKELSLLTGRECIDIDLEIVKNAGRSIPQIFQEGGEETFRSIETKTLKDICKLSGRIITTGGGTVLRRENYPLLHQNGRIYHITRKTELLDTAGRPLSHDLEDMFKKRMPLYRSFSDAEFSNNGTVLQTAKDILEDFNESFSN